jgi:hypothetical protein
MSQTPSFRRRNASHHPFLLVKEYEPEGLLLTDLAFYTSDQQDAQVPSSAGDDVLPTHRDVASMNQGMSVFMSPSLDVTATATNDTLEATQALFPFQRVPIYRTIFFIFVKRTEGNYIFDPAYSHIYFQPSEATRSSMSSPNSNNNVFPKLEAYVPEGRFEVYVRQQMYFFLCLRSRGQCFNGLYGFGNLDQMGSCPQPTWSAYPIHFWKRDKMLWDKEEQFASDYEGEDETEDKLAATGGHWRIRNSEVKLKASSAAEQRSCDSNRPFKCPVNTCHHAYTAEIPTISVTLNAKS